REDAPAKRGERRLEIDERDPFVYREPLDLLEHGGVRRVERIPAVTAPRDDDPNWRWIALERPDLHRRGVRAQQHVAAQTEAVLRVERRMVLGKVQRVEVVALGLGFGADDAREAQLLEDVADLVDDLRDDVDAAAPLGPAGHRDIVVGESQGDALEHVLNT